MTNPKVVPYGSWESPITADLIVKGTIGLGEVVVDGKDIYWTESRPEEGGRSALVRRNEQGKVEDLLPVSFNVRTRVHEYGGGAFTVTNGAVYFSHFVDSRIYRKEQGEAAEPITAERAVRYADLEVDARRNRLICVREDHRDAGREAVNTLVAVSLDGDEVGKVLVEGNDFYSNPRVSPDGSRLAWLTWNHPNMPWDGTELWVADIAEDGSLSGLQKVAGGKDESIFQPEWSPNGVLYFVSDKTEWWNLYCVVGGQIEPVCQMDAEFGRPQWVFGMKTYGFASEDRIVCTYTQNGVWSLASIDTSAKKFEPIDTPYTVISDVVATPEFVLFDGGSATEPSALVKLEFGTSRLEVLRKASEVAIDEKYLSVPKSVEFPTENGLTAFGIYYPPKNGDFTGPEGERPPLVVFSHGGPTSATYASFNLSIQFWTSRGIGVLDVNYGGSAGYGRSYRQRLNGMWGVVDVQDCVNGARYLVKTGEADGNRLAIRGGSAGGYTTLAALTFADTFKAGASYFGVSDIELLAKDTHKFESRYMDGLVGPYPEAVEVYHERSPLYHTDRLSCPIIFFQGLDDKIVPPNQAELMVQKMRDKGLPVAYIAYEGEGHGFRKAENIKRSMTAELYFYGKMFGFDVSTDIEPVQIYNA